jgi:hypothetical protein
LLDREKDKLECEEEIMSAREAPIVEAERLVTSLGDNTDIAESKLATKILSKIF